MPLINNLLPRCDLDLLDGKNDPESIAQEDGKRSKEQKDEESTEW